MIKMNGFKSWLICLAFVMDYTVSVTSENSENINNNNVTHSYGTYLQSIVHCVRKQSKLLPYCVFKQSLRHLDNAIASNETWQLNGYVSLKKNENWKPIVLEARAMRTPYGQILSKVSDLLTSRSLQFTLPPHDDDDRREGRYYGSDGGSHGIVMGMSFDASICCMILIRFAFARTQEETKRYEIRWHCFDRNGGTTVHGKNCIFGRSIISSIQIGIIIFHFRKISLLFVCWFLVVPKIKLGFSRFFFSVDRMH